MDENPNNNVNSFDNVFSSLIQVIIVISSGRPCYKSQKTRL